MLCKSSFENSHFGMSNVPHAIRKYITYVEMSPFKLPLKVTGIIL